MADIFSPEKRSEVMSKITSKDTKPELVVRKLLFSLGYRYRLHRKDLPGKPDIVLPKFKTVIFVHGCFWHQHDGCVNTRMPQTNEAYWLPKLRNNVERDKVAVQDLQKIGWNVITIWECQTKNIKDLEIMLRSAL